MRMLTRILPGKSTWHRPPAVPAGVVTYRGDDAACALLSTTEREQRTHALKAVGPERVATPH